MGAHPDTFQALGSVVEFVELLECSSESSQCFTGGCGVWEVSKGVVFFLHRSGPIHKRATNCKQNANLTYLHNVKGTAPAIS